MRQKQLRRLIETKHVTVGGDTKKICAKMNRIEIAHALDEIKGEWKQTD